MMSIVTWIIVYLSSPYVKKIHIYNAILKLNVVFSQAIQRIQSFQSNALRTILNASCMSPIIPPRMIFKSLRSWQPNPLAHPFSLNTSSTVTALVHRPIEKDMKWINRKDKPKSFIWLIVKEEKKSQNVENRFNKLSNLGNISSINLNNVVSNS
jgi:hypothetical protein